MDVNAPGTHPEGLTRRFKRFLQSCAHGIRKDLGDLCVELERQFRLELPVRTPKCCPKCVLTTTGCVSVTLGDMPLDIANEDLPLAQGGEMVPRRIAHKWWVLRIYTFGTTVELSDNSDADRLPDADKVNSAWG